MNDRAKKSIITILIIILGFNVIYCISTAVLGDDSSYRTFLLLLMLLVMILGLVIVGTAFARENITQGHIGVIYRTISIEEQMSQRRDAIRSEHGGWLFGIIIFFSGLLLLLYNWLLGDYFSSEFSINLPLWSHSIIPAIIIVVLLYYRKELIKLMNEQSTRDKDIIMREREPLKVHRIESEKGRVLKAVKRPRFLYYSLILLLSSVALNLYTTPSKVAVNPFFGLLEVAAAIASISLIYQLWIISPWGWKIATIFFSADLLVRTGIIALFSAGLFGLSFQIFTVVAGFVFTGFFISVITDLIIIIFVYRNRELFIKSAEIEFI
ncbi:MAG: hypothetical protein ACTSRU_07665 [Candidatus Hodarchaeales archaeon]